MNIHIIVGPTASGKTKVAHYLADSLNCPLINADAYQIYKDMNIGTNKISKDDPHYSRYHLLDIVSPDCLYNVATYQKAFRETINELSKKHNDVVVVGGNGLYIRSSIYDYVFMEESVKDLDFSDVTNDELYSMLLEKDPKAAEKIHKNNRKRVIRALTIYECSEWKKSESEEKQAHKLIYSEKALKIYFINPDRNVLYNRIDERVDEMVNNGLFDEVEYLIENYYLSKTAKAAIGYKEIIAYRNGELDKNECIDLIKKHSRNYAKRQVTFFKNQFKYVEYKSSDELIEEFKNGKSI